MTTTLKTWLKRSVAISTVAAGALAFGAPSAQAGTLNSQFTVQTTVNTACTAFSTPTLIFPSYVSGQSSADTAQTTFSITCPGASAATPEDVNITFTGGTGFTMTGTAGSLNYSLCADSACASPYTMGSAGPNVSIQQATAFSLPIYGSIAASLTPAVGSYSQTLTAVLTY